MNPQLKWNEIPAQTGFQLVYKLVKKAENLQVPGPQKKEAVLQALDECKRSNSRFARDIASFEHKAILDDIIETVALSNQGIRKLPQIIERDKRDTQMQIQQIEYDAN
jgi:hypothetical protein